MKYSLQWLLNIKRNELTGIESSLAEVNNKINVNMDIQNENINAIQSHQERMCSYTNSWEIQSSVRAIDTYEKKNLKLKKELDFLNKEKEMILQRYNSKHVEIKALETSRDNFLEKEKKKKQIKEAAEINELALITRKDK